MSQRSPLDVRSRPCRLAAARGNHHGLSGCQYCHERAGNPRPRHWEPGGDAVACVQHWHPGLFEHLLPRVLQERQLRQRAGVERHDFHSRAVRHVPWRCNTAAEHTGMGSAEDNRAGRHTSGCGQPGNTVQYLSRRCRGRELQDHQHGEAHQREAERVWRGAGLLAGETEHPCRVWVRGLSLTKDGGMEYTP